MQVRDFTALLTGAEGQRLQRTVEPTLWARGPATFDGDWISLDRKRVDVYPFLQAEEALDSLLAIEKPEDALAFVERFGLLLKGPGTVPEKPQDADLRERWGDWRREISALRAMAELYMQLQDAARGDGAAMHLLEESAPKIAHILKVQAPKTDSDVLGFVATTLAAWLSSRLEGGTQRVEASVMWSDESRISPARFFFGFAPRHLLSWAYYQLAVYAVDSVPVRICDGCGRLFIPSDARQVYHDSRCAARARQKRLRNRSATRKRPGGKRR